jgi:nucleoid-associated protein YgaU
MARRHILLALAVILGLGAAVAQAQAPEMTMQDYEKRLKDCQTRQRIADSTRVAMEERIAQIKTDIGSTENQITTINQEVMKDVAGDSAALRDTLSKLNSMLQQLRNLRNLSADQIVDAREAGELDKIEKQLADIKKLRMAALPEVSSRIRAIESLITSLRAVERPAPAIRTDQYTVVRGDHLWRISRRADMYGNPFAWVRLYSANKDMIKDPNLIYPDWVLSVPRNQAPGTYWVQERDNLSSIASRAEVYGDPTKWTQLYSANSDAIETLGGDKHTIFPHMILKVQ